MPVWCDGIKIMSAYIRVLVSVSISSSLCNSGYILHVCDSYMYTLYGKIPTQRVHSERNVDDQYITEKVTIAAS